MIYPGQLDIRAVWQRPLREAANAFGEALDVWQDVAPAMIALEQVAATEDRSGPRRIVTTSWRVTAHYRAGVDATWRLKIGGGDAPRYLHVVSVKDVDGRHIALELACVERSE